MLACLLLSVFAVVALSVAQEAPGTITTVAGNGRQGFSGDGGPATQASLDAPTGLAVDAKGNIYFSEFNSHRVRRISPDGLITTVAGTGAGDFSGDGGSAAKAGLNSPRGVAVDVKGDLYIADWGNLRVRRVGQDGIITTYAGTGTNGSSGGGGPAVQAGLSNPWAVATDKGNVFIAEGNRVHRVGSGGLITTIAGTPGAGSFSGDGGPALGASLSQAAGVAVDAQGNVYIADRFNYRIRRVGLDGVISTFAGSGPTQLTNTSIGGFSGDGGPATQALLNPGPGVAVDPRGIVYIPDTGNHRIRRVGLDGVISTLAGNGLTGFSGDGGPATQARLDLPSGVAVGPDGAIYIADANNHRIRRVSPLLSPDIRLLISSLSLDSTKVGAASQKTFSISNPGRAPLSIFGMTLEGSDEFRVSPNTATVSAGDSLRVTVTFSPLSAGDKAARLILRHDAGLDALTVALTGKALEVTGPGIIITFAGTGIPGASPEGQPAKSVTLSSPTGIVVDPLGRVFVADLGNHRVKLVGIDGILTTVAGTGVPGYSGDDGPAAQAALNQPSDLVLDVKGNLYIADRANHRVRRVGTDGVITTIAGTGGAGYSGDGSGARFEKLNQPSGLALDTQGNLYIADRANHRIRKVAPNNVISTVAGTGRAGYSGDGGAGAQAAINDPRAVATDAKGNLFIADAGNHRVRRLGPDGVIETVAGTGRQGFSGDGGPALSADLSGPAGVWVDADRNLTIADAGNRRIRKVKPDGVITTVVGGGVSLGDGGPAEKAGLRDPTGVVLDLRGNLYIADAGDHRVRRVETLRASVTIPSRSADFDNSGRVDLDDFFLFAGGFGQKGEGDAARFDLDGDGSVGFGDFFLFAEKFGQKI